MCAHRACGVVLFGPMYWRVLLCALLCFTVFYGMHQCTTMYYYDVLHCLLQVHTRSHDALAEVRALVGTVLKRAQQAQEDLHGRVMLRQIAHDEYVPAATPLDVEVKLVHIMCTHVYVCIHTLLSV